jgi:AGZA family xanthine/uracil permease-like MFS transporter
VTSREPAELVHASQQSGSRVEILMRAKGSLHRPRALRSALLRPRVDAGTPPAQERRASKIVESYFRFGERGVTLGTEIRAGITTFLVMAYILAVNPSILGAGLKLDPVSVASATALVAGIMTIAMGVIGNYPFALAAGLGINAIVAFTLPAKGLSPAGAMGVIVLEGLAITILVVIGLREAIMHAVPLALKRAIGVGIGLFILFIGFANGGLIVTPQGGVPLVTLSFPTQPGQFVFLLGLIITIALWVMKVRGALIISILVTTILALVTGVQTIPKEFAVTPNFSTIGQFDLGNAFSAIGVLAAVLTIFAIMLSDFFDTMGTVTGVAAEAGLTKEDGSVPGVGRVLLVDSLAAVAGGVAGISSNTTYIESAAGVAEGGKTGMTAVVTGILFLLAIFLAPLAAIIPLQATAPALVLVGYLMFMQVAHIKVDDVEDGLPALFTMILMPLTYDITVGIGAGFISWVLIKLVRGKTTEVHWLMWLVSLAFVLYFAKDWIIALLPS